MPKVSKEISVRGETYYPVPAVASRVKLHRATLSRWASQGVTPEGEELKVVRDKTNGHLYIAAISVDLLSKNYKPEVRFEFVGTAASSSGLKLNGSPKPGNTRNGHSAGK